MFDDERFHKAVMEWYEITCPILENWGGFN